MQIKELDFFAHILRTRSAHLVLLVKLVNIVELYEVAIFEQLVGLWTHLRLFLET